MQRPGSWGAVAVLTVLACAGPASAALPQQTGVLDLASPGAGAFEIRGAGGARAGHAVADAGDVNGDGVGDLVIGAPQADSPGTNGGAAHVVFGPVTGTISLGNLGARGFTIRGPAGAFLGTSVAGAGDVDGDGRADVVVGATGANGGAGAAYVVFGRTGTTPVDAGALGAGGIALTGPAGAGAGFAVAGVPDMTGDGRPEIAVGAPDLDVDGVDSGTAWVVFGRGAGTVDLGTLSAAAGLRIDGEDASDFAGQAVAGLPDTNGDGHGEVAVGATGAGGGTGAAYVAFGRTPGGTIALDAFPFAFRATARVDLGARLATLGDQDGDGRADLLVGSRGANTFLGRTNGGSAFLAFGRATDAQVDLAATGGVELGGPAQTRTGAAVGGLRDVNGAGGPDLAVGAPCADPSGRTDAGSTYVVFREPARTGGQLDLSALTLGTEGYRIDGPQAQTTCLPNAVDPVLSLAGTGDVTGDGRPDLLVGVPLSDVPGADDGGVWVVRGFGAPAFTLPASAAGTVGAPLATIAPADVARTGPAEFAVAPPLPAGLALDLATGAISGTPTAPHPATAHTVTMTDLAGATGRAFTLSIAAAPAPGPGPETPGVTTPPITTTPPPTVRRWPRLTARVRYTVTGSRLSRLTVAGLSSRTATLTVRCVRCGGPASKHRVTVRAPLTAARVRRGLRRVVGVPLTRRSTITVTVTRRNAIGYWWRLSAGPRDVERCLPANSRTPRRTCSSRRPAA